MVLGGSGWVPRSATAGPEQARAVSQRPVAWTPHVLDGVVHAIAVVGDVAVVGGRFQSVREADATAPVVRQFLFAFELGTGRLLPSFIPRLNRPVLALAAGPDKTVYVGGSFTTVNGESRAGVTRLRLTDGSIWPGFAGGVSAGWVSGLAWHGAYVYASGAFRRIGGADRRSVARLDAQTGRADAEFDLRLGRPAARKTSVQGMALSNDGSLLGLVGSFTRAGGRDRYQLALFDVSGRRPELTPWTTDAFQRSACILIGHETTYLRALDFSPDGTYFVVVTTGHLNEPRKLCDTAVRFNVAGAGNHRPVWVNHTGANTLLSVEVTGSAVYVGGHQSWLDNTYGWKWGGPGAVWRPGIGALRPGTGTALPWNPTHDRGNGVEVIVAHPGGILVGSDTDHCGYEYHARLCDFPLSGTGERPGSPVTTRRR
jgi:hypothetical protein